jgi:hypothetical protein
MKQAGAVLFIILIRKNGGEVNSSIIYLIYCKNFCKCYYVSPPSTTVKERLTEGSSVSRSYRK